MQLCGDNAVAYFPWKYLPEALLPPFFFKRPADCTTLQSGWLVHFRFWILDSGFWILHSGFSEFSGVRIENLEDPGLERPFARDYQHRTGKSSCPTPEPIDVSDKTSKLLCQLFSSCGVSLARGHQTWRRRLLAAANKHAIIPRCTAYTAVHI